MLKSVGLGSDMLWKGTIPLQKKHFTINLFIAFAVVLSLPPPPPPTTHPPILFFEGPP